MLEHGGNVNTLSRQFNIDADSYIDLSTGINPHNWPIPDFLPQALWSQLPQQDDGLIDAAQTYYRCSSLLAVSGSQAAIQSLPYCRSHSRVGVLSLAYAEHQHAWQQAGHDIKVLEPDSIDIHIHRLDVLIIINPNNPTGQRFTQQQLRHWHQQLNQRGGWLIIDEAFIDATPEHSLSTECPQSGLIILRSIGKFFGLAGIRVGFVLAEKSLLDLLAERLGPWPISGVSRYISQLALADTSWQSSTRNALSQHKIRLVKLLTEAGFKNVKGCALFQWVETPLADKIFEHLASQGIFIRLFKKPNSLRFGLPKTEQEWQQLELALQGLSRI